MANVAGPVYHVYNIREGEKTGFLECKLCEIDQLVAGEFRNYLDSLSTAIYSTAHDRRLVSSGSRWFSNWWV